MFRRCDVVLLPFPFTDLSAAKRRPVLLPTDPDARGDFLAAQVTSQSGHHDAHALHPADLALGSLPKASYVRVSKLFTLNVSLVAHRAAGLTEGAFKRVREEICAALGCSRWTPLLRKPASPAGRERPEAASR
jgi:mRNA interferase MazF